MSELSFKAQTSTDHCLNSVPGRLNKLGLMKTSFIVVLVFLFCFWKSLGHGVLASFLSSTTQGKRLMRREVEVYSSRIKHQGRKNIDDVHHVDRRDTRRLLGYDMRTIRHWVSAHNEERRLFYPEGGLSWDLSLAKFAQRHADSIGHNINCSPEFNEDNEEYGENLFWGVYEHGEDGWSVREVVEYWIKQAAGHGYTG